jgi:hypothetical protein
MAYERIWVETGVDNGIVIEVDDSPEDGGPAQAMQISIPQAKQLILDLQALIDGKEPSDDPEVDEVE